MEQETKFTVSLWELENAAFGEHPQERLVEIARILRNLADRLEDKGASGCYENLFDANGNIVGNYKLSRDFT